MILLLLLRFFRDLLSLMIDMAFMFAIWVYVLN